MFGPDQCNADKRTHLIFTYNGKNYLKKSELPFKQEGEGLSHLYRLVLKPDSTVRVEVDQEKIYEGSLSDDWEMLPEKEIIDPTDKKPANWVEDAMMDDPNDSKPADWVDQKRIVDKDSKKPEEWDDEEDGEYEAPMIENPDFKGEWARKRIANPEFTGLWQAKKIPNPDFVDDPALYKYSDIGYVGFDIWQVKGGTIFDNIILTDSITEADDFANKWKALSDVEKEKQKGADDAQNEAFAKARAARAARAAAAKEKEEKEGKGKKENEESDLADDETTKLKDHDEL